MDLAAELARQAGFYGSVVGADFVVPMLARGRTKAARAVPVAADALTLPFPDASFDGAMVGFGLRNLADLDAGLREAARVLKPGARFVALEFSTPRLAPLRAVYLFYFRRVLPVVGRVVSKHTDAYTYLPESVLAFPDPDAFAARFTAAGFRDVRYDVLAGGICALHHGAR
jgi:demethylmenaquinone methyltransferase/2-methoxy-6-polyprenyl-1,4-benzoquinol methylase